MALVCLVLIVDPGAIVEGSFAPKIPYSSFLCCTEKSVNSDFWVKAVEGVDDVLNGVLKNRIWGCLLFRHRSTQIVSDSISA